MDAQLSKDELEWRQGIGQRRSQIGQKRSLAVGCRSEEWQQVESFSVLLAAAVHERVTYDDLIECNGQENRTQSRHGCGK